MNTKLMERIKEVYSEFVRNYRMGCEHFGFWWTLFTVSMFSISLVFLQFAMVLAVLYL